MPERGEEKGQMVYHTTHPGDLGQRLATGRKALGLTREQAAARVGMAVAYLAYIDENPAIVGLVCLMRLADALDTTAYSLLGAESVRSSADLAASGSAVP
jgi:transcriptional regulator with XRE-family HTH domain